LLPSAGLAQTPGNLVNPDLWIKADVGLVGANPITSWNDQSANLNHPTINGDPSVQTSNFNYNPTIALDGVGDFFSWGPLISGVNEGEVFTVLSIPTAITPVVRELWDFGNPGSGSSHPYSDGSSYDDFGSGIASVMTVGNSFLNWTDVTQPYIYNTGGDAAGTINYTQGVQASIGDPLVVFGNTATIGKGDFIGGSLPLIASMAEVIIFPYKLTLLEERTVWSYLAVKYGITLAHYNGGAEGDYVATDGTLIWDATLSLAYHNDVIGLGRDDNENLLQKQSHSYDDTSRVYLSNLTATNDVNAGLISANVSYLLMGNNPGEMCSAAATITEVPVVPNITIIERLDREWKVTKTNFSDPVNIDLTLAGCAQFDASCYTFMVDDDGDFSNGGTSLYMNNDGTGIIITESAGIVTIDNLSDIHLVNNTTSYFTLASYVPDMMISNDTIVCSGASVDLSVIGVGLDFLWDNSLGTGSMHTVTPMNTTTYTVIGTDIFACSTTDSVLVDLTLDANVSAGLDQFVCENTALVLSASGADNYTWDNGVVDGVVFNQLPGTIDYIVTGTTIGGCIGTDTLTITVYPQTNSNLGNDTTLCPGDLLLLDATAVGANYLWQDNSSNPTYEVSAAGTYWVDVDLNGCPTTDSIIVSYATLPLIDLGADTLLCPGENLLLDVTALGATYLWSNGQTSAAIDVNQEDTYSVQVMIGTCVISDDITVTNIQLPSDILGLDQTLCEGELLILDATIAGGSNYLWQDNSTNPILNVSLGGTYSIALNFNGCLLNDVIVIDFNSLPNVSFNGPTEGCEPFTGIFMNTTPNAQNCIWEFSDGTIINDCGSISSDFSAGLYDVSLTVTSLDGCTNSLMAAGYLNVSAQPEAAFGSSAQNIFTDNTLISFYNNSLNASTYEWDFGDNAINSNEINPAYQFPVLPGNYVVTLWAYADSPICYDSTQHVITVIEELLFYVPNAFTPDSDQFNESFKPVFTSGYDPYDFHLSVFNRWGELIFESYNAAFGWDGNYGSGGLVQDGTYVWQIDFKDANSDKRFLERGTVNVLK
jgi:gliding motility-associated-like protein